MWHRHPVFPKVPSDFWRRFRRRWTEPLQMLEEIISLGESLGVDPTSPRFEGMDEEYWSALRSLHSRTCLHARAVLALLSNGLVDPAWAQWRVCHESSTVAQFIADNPDMARRYVIYSLVNKHDLAKVLDASDHQERLSKPEFDELEELAGAVKQELRDSYDRGDSSRVYAWSGLRTFKEIEEEAFKAADWNPRPHYILASERVHAAPNAGEPYEISGSPPVFVIGPINAGLTGPADLTAISTQLATGALLQNASHIAGDEEILKKLSVIREEMGAICWIHDPEVFCQGCGGHVPGASAPDLIPLDNRPKPCSCEDPYQ